MSKFAVFIAASMVACVMGAGLPVFPNDWSCVQIQGIQINQGGIAQPDGSVCCPFNSPECKVQTAYEAGLFYFDLTNQRTAFKSPDGSGIVTLFKDEKEYQVAADGTCQAYCPVQGNLTAMGFPENAVNLGSTTYKGMTVDQIQWKVIVPVFNITMQVSDFYVVPGTQYATPVAEIDYIEPLGEQIGLQNTTYARFAAGPQDAAHFVVKGAASCPMSKNCGNNDDQSGGDDDAPKKPSNTDLAVNHILSNAGPVLSRKLRA